METALTPLEFARRARKLYGGLSAVMDEDSTFTFEQFFDRCDRWSTALQHFGVRPRFTFVKELPKTATGKLQKYVLRRGSPVITAI